MKNYLSLFFLLSNICSFSQENLEPLKSNFKLLENSLINRTSTINNNDFIYLTDTIDLPVIDDFSTNKFKNYLTMPLLIIFLIQIGIKFIFWMGIKFLIHLVT